MINNANMQPSFGKMRITLRKNPKPWEEALLPKAYQRDIHDNGQVIVSELKRNDEGKAFSYTLAIRPKSIDNYTDSRHKFFEQEAVTREERLAEAYRREGFKVETDITHVKNQFEIRRRVNDAMVKINAAHRRIQTNEVDTEFLT